ncbi:DNA-directed RNA polymerase subunit alpha [bacterium]|nr:DNA-directed RNA polymerase subunit alpha [bacterium]
MPLRLGRFELPNRLQKEEDGSTETYAKFIAEPFEAGYGHTLGNSLRRVLLSSLEGAAITSVKISGVQHEFSTIDNVVEDVTEIVLNLKKLKFKLPNREPRLLSLKVNKEGPVTGADIELDAGIELLNPKEVICTLDKKTKFEAELEVRVGRGYATWEENKREDSPIGLIPVDSLFSPTDYDKLVIELWTDGRLTPDEAMLHSAGILRHHLDIFANFDKEPIEFEEVKFEAPVENTALKKLLAMSVNEIELSVRAANCLNNANITTVGQLALKSEAEMLKYRNFGKKSLNEIKDKLTSLGLSLGMKFDSSLLTSIPVVPPVDAAGANGQA